MRLPLYFLAFYSKHKTGMKFWDEVRKSMIEEMLMVVMRGFPYTYDMSASRCFTSAFTVFPSSPNGNGLSKGKRNDDLAVRYFSSPPYPRDGLGGMNTPMCCLNAAK